ncbi:acyl-CoA dehydrogenase [Rhodoferax koreense]|uniref:Acyl-CoA dehydrogenase n=1 Tax=Rhodoferax koreensis TaxID=1842727 RepID=A0A1P8JUS6_9BURK|nr:acyl-CoA dehydrogenase family protein [Rhodoferax koreense]APW37441.1 acyl-CoA dehydrogenase [Rhodoferax koreense]
MIERTLFTAEHEIFRDRFRRFIEREIAPFHADWEEQGHVDRVVWHKAGDENFLCTGMPETYGGTGADKLHAVVQLEELARGGFSGIGYGMHSETVAPYLLRHGTVAQKQNYLPRLAFGDMVGAFAITEPGAGSDLAAIQATAMAQADGSFVLNGSKTFVTNGWHADLVIVAAKTDPAAGAEGISLFLVERGMAGFSTGRRLRKLGMKAQDMAELFFDNLRLPATQLLGGPALLNRGHACVTAQQPWERLQIAIAACASAQAAIEWTVDYVLVRNVFGQPVASFQNTRHTLAALQTEVQVAQVFVDRCIELVLHDRLDLPSASMAKYWSTDLQCKVMDACAQLFGGYGCLWDYPIARAHADARVQRMQGGTNEIMKETVAQAMGLG